MADISMTVELRAKNGERTQRVIKGTTGDIYKIRKEVRQAGKEMNMTSRQIEGAVKRAVRGVKALKGASGSLKVSGTNLQGRFGTVAQQKMQLRVTRANVQTQERLAQSMRNVLRASKSRAIQSYTAQISKMRQQMLDAGLSIDKVEGNLKQMHLALRRVKRFNVGRRADVMAGKGMGVEQARLMGAGLVSREKSRMQGLTPDVQKRFRDQQHQMMVDAQSMMQKYGDVARMGAMQASGAIGFTLIDIGTKLQNFFSEARLKGQLSGASSNVAGAIGGIFGDAVGSITSDLGKAAGSITEIFINLVTFNLRKWGTILGGVTKALGYTIASGMIGGLLGGLTTGFNPVAVAISAGVAALIFGVISGMQALGAIVSTVVGDILDTASKALTAATSIITAGLKTIGLTFGAIAKGVMRLWKELWKGIMNFTQASIDKITSMLSKFTRSALKNFMTLEKGATRAAKEVADVYGQATDQMQRSIASVAMGTGLGIMDVSNSAFNTVSSGYRSVSEQMMIMHEASKLALADMTSMANATKSLTTIYNNFKDQVSSVAEVGKILAASTTLGVATLEEMGPALTFVAPTAKRYNLALEDIAATMSVMTRLFGRGSASRVARYLNRGLEAIFMPRSGGAKELEKMGISVKELFDIAKTSGVTQAWGSLLEKLKGVPFDKIRKVFPTIQARRFQIMMDHVGDFRDVLKEMENIDPNIQAKMASRTTERVLAKISNTLKLIMSRFGMIISKTLKFLIYNRDMAKLWNKLGKIMFSKAMNKRLNSAGKILRGILIPAAYSLYMTFSRIVKAVSKMATGTLFDNDALFSMAASIRGVFNEIYKFMERLTGNVEFRDWLLMILDETARIAKQIRSMFKALNMPIDEVMGNIESWWGDAKPKLANFANLVGDYLYNKMNEFFAIIGLNFGEILVNAYDSLMGANLESSRLKKTFEILALSIKLIFSKLWSDIFLDLLENFLTSKGPLIKQVRSAIKQIYTAILIVFLAAKGVKAIFDALVGSVKLVYKAVWNLANLLYKMQKLTMPKAVFEAREKLFGTGDMLEKLNPDNVDLNVKSFGSTLSQFVLKLKGLKGGEGTFAELQKLFLGAYGDGDGAVAAIDALRAESTKRQIEIREQLEQLRREAKSNAGGAKGELAAKAQRAIKALEEKLEKAKQKRIGLDIEHEMRKGYGKTGDIVKEAVPGLVGGRPETVKDMGEGGYVYKGDFSGQSPKLIASILHKIARNYFKGTSDFAKSQVPISGGDALAQAKMRSKAMQIALQNLDLKPRQLRGKSPEELERILTNAFIRGAKEAMVRMQKGSTEAGEIQMEDIGAGALGSL